MICVTHEIGFARTVADRIVMMERGQIVEEGPPRELFANARNPRTREYLQRIGP